MPIESDALPTPEGAIEFFNIRPESDNMPMLLFSGERGIVVAVLADVGPGGMGPMLEQVLPRLIEAQGEPKWIVLCAEAWQKAYDDKDKAPKGGHRPGELQERAEAGDPTIVECVMANGFSRDAEFSAMQPFERKDDEVVWGELRVMEDSTTLAGAIPDAIRPIFA